MPDKLQGHPSLSPGLSGISGESQPLGGERGQSFASVPEQGGSTQLQHGSLRVSVPACASWEGSAVGSVCQTWQAALGVFLAGGCGKCWKGKREQKQSVAQSAWRSDVCARWGALHHTLPGPSAWVKSLCSLLYLAARHAPSFNFFSFKGNSSSLIAFQGIRWDRQTACREEPRGLFLNPPPSPKHGFQQVEAAICRERQREGCSQRGLTLLE